MSAKEMLEFVEKAYNEGNMSVWEYEKFKKEFREISAKEMFEELGYRQTDNFPTYIEYLKEGNTKITEITFDLEEKRVIKQDFNTGFSYYIKYEELQAINKQIEELGWNK